MMNAALVFDPMAASYDALWTATPNGRAQRNQVWRHVDALFQPEMRILDVGCGTGVDAAHLSERGVRVCATDVSAAMVHLAKARGGFTAAVCSAEELAQFGGKFDGAFSNFGALNCVADLAAAARSLAGLVDSGGPVAICLMGRCCAWEMLYYALRRRFRKAFRRWHPVTYRGLAIHYPSVAQVRAAFAPHFELRRWTGIGLLVPPSYVKLPAALVRVLAACDRLLAGLPLVRALADHRLFVFERK